jgi:hypothetical protein
MKKPFVYLITVILILLLIVVLSIFPINSYQQVDRNMLDVVLIDLFNENLSDANYYGITCFYVSIDGQDIDKCLASSFNNPIRTIKVKPLSESYKIDTKNISIDSLAFLQEYRILVRDIKTNERGIQFELITHKDKNNSYSVKVYTYAGGLFSSEKIYTLEKKYNLWMLVDKKLIWIS